MDEMKIQPNDIVLHRPTGETWTVCGAKIIKEDSK